MIPRSFFQQDPLTCSRELVGAELIWGECRGIIVETEAYSAIDDEASHIFMRPSVPPWVAEKQPGTGYVYMNYGMHWLLNVLVKGGGEEGFVLIRAVEPTAGIKLMQARRKRTKLEDLCSGPGKLAQAFGITGVDHGRDLCSGEVGFGPRPKPVKVATDVRVGISRSAHLQWRFLIPDNPHVSVKHGKVPTPKVRTGIGRVSRHSPKQS